jgi:hypothetical protein
VLGQLYFGGMATKTTSQPTFPYERDGKWYFTYFTLSGPKEWGPYADETIAQIESSKVARIHQANGFTDGEVGISS